MRVTDRIPLLWNRGKHSPDTVIRNLRDENRRLHTFRMAADDYFALLLQDRDEVYGAWEYEKQRRAEAEIVAACVQSEREALADEVEDLRAELAPYRAAEANAAAITLPPLERDTTHLADQATEPVRVLTLAEAFGSNDPAHIPRWAQDTGPAA